MAKRENAVVAKELKERGLAELKSLLAQKQDELAKLRQKHALRQLRTTHVLKELKRDVARINTVLSQRAQAGSQA